MGMKQLFCLWVSGNYWAHKTPALPVVKMIQPRWGWEGCGYLIPPVSLAVIIV